MARGIWTGALSFGLVNIPVEVHTAVRDHRPRFRLLHDKDKSPINYERICQKEGEPVAWNDLVKGYEYEKGRFVILTKDDFAAAALEKTRRIDILDFVKGESIDDRFFGIAKFIMREVQHLAAVEVVDEALVLSTLRFDDELVDVKTLNLPKRTTVKKKELDMAVSLVESLADEWQPEKYTDDYLENLMRVIKAKMKGKRANLVVEEPPRDAKVVDLMERLRQSLDAHNRRGGSRRAAAPARRSRPAGARARRATPKRARAS
jgi:DNA end-binding protein Ku